MQSYYNNIKGSGFCLFSSFNIQDDFTFDPSCHRNLYKPQKVVFFILESAEYHCWQEAY